MLLLREAGRGYIMLYDYEVKRLYDLLLSGYVDGLFYLCSWDMRERGTGKDDGWKEGF